MFEKTLEKQDHRRVWFKEYSWTNDGGIRYPKYVFSNYENRLNSFPVFQVKLVADPENGQKWIIRLEALLGAKLEDITCSAEYVMSHFSTFVRDLSERMDLTDDELDSVARNRLEFELESITILVTRENYPHRVLHEEYESKKRQMKMA